jgi:hypothetical protein
MVSAFFLEDDMDIATALTYTAGYLLAVSLVGLGSTLAWMVTKK